MTDDLDQIMAVMEAAFDPAYGEAWTRRQVGDALTVPGTYYLLADESGRPPAPNAAAVAFSLSRKVLDEEELLLLAVAPDARGRGVGGALLLRLLEKARERGAARMFLEMRDGNTAEALYRRYGFTPLGRRRHYYRRGSGTPHDAITFGRPL
jgi:ribosomal-protein-alanine N-acetyltransferase